MKKRKVEGSLHPGSGVKHPTSDGAKAASGKQARFTREETTTRILDAAEDLFSRRDPAGVTVREIAEAAGVTHPLVHQYVGSKADIRRAVVERGAPRRQKIIAEHRDLSVLIPVLAEDMIANRAHTRSIVRSAMDGIEYAPLDQRIENAQALMRLAAESTAQGNVRRTPAPAVDPRVVLAASTALIMGWVATEDWLAKMFGLEGDDLAEARTQIGVIAAHIADLLLPPAGGSAPDER